MNNRILYIQDSPKDNLIIDLLQNSNAKNMSELLLNYSFKKSFFNYLNTLPAQEKSQILDKLSNPPSHNTPTSNAPPLNNTPADTSDDLLITEESCLEKLALLKQQKRKIFSTIQERQSARIKKNHEDQPAEEFQIEDAPENSTDRGPPAFNQQMPQQMPQSPVYGINNTYSQQQQMPPPINNQLPPKPTFYSQSQKHINPYPSYRPPSNFRYPNNTLQKPFNRPPMMLSRPHSNIRKSDKDSSFPGLEQTQKNRYINYSHQDKPRYMTNTLHDKTQNRYYANSMEGNNPSRYMAQEKPRYIGNNSIPDNPRYLNNNYPDKPRFMNSNLPEKPRYLNNSLPEKPRYMNSQIPDNQRYMNNNNSLNDKPRFMNNPLPDKPRYMNNSNSLNDKPRFMNTNLPDKPRYMNNNNSTMDKPRYMNNSVDNQPTRFGNNSYDNSTRHMGNFQESARYEGRQRQPPQSRFNNERSSFNSDRLPHNNNGGGTFDGNSRFMNSKNIGRGGYRPRGGGR